MLHIYTGEGKGKTTSAIGQMTRFLGYNKKVVFSQFLKTTQSGEILFFEKYCKDNVTIIRNNKQFPFSNKMTDVQKDEIRQIHNKILDKIIDSLNNENIEMVILDEIISTYNIGLIDREKVDDFIFNINENIELIITGRDCPEKFLKKADYISNIENKKNPFDSGVVARIGIEY